MSSGEGGDGGLEPVVGAKGEAHSPADCHDPQARKGRASCGLNASVQVACLPHRDGQSYREAPKSLRPRPQRASTGG